MSSRFSVQSQYSWMLTPNTLILTPESAVGALTERTRAVIPVHLYGQMADMAGLRAALATRPDVAIIEDFAHCFEGERDGHKPGAHSTCAIFSFYATKNVTCGEGGVLITNDKALHEKFLATRLHGMSAGAIDRFKGGSYRHWDMVRLGVKAPERKRCSERLLHFSPVHNSHAGDQRPSFAEGRLNPYKSGVFFPLAFGA